LSSSLSQAFIIFDLFQLVVTLSSIDTSLPEV